MYVCMYVFQFQLLSSLLLIQIPIKALITVDKQNSIQLKQAKYRFNSLPIQAIMVPENKSFNIFSSKDVLGEFSNELAGAI